MATNPNHPAFPCTTEDGMVELQAFGLTKREYFAGLAMQGFCANPNGVKVNGEYVDLDKASVQAADALIRELSE